MSFAFAIIPPKLILGQNTSLGVTIYQVSPANAISLNGSSTLLGTVGQLFNLQGTIYISNGSYQIIFANQVVASGTSEGYFVDKNFSIPEVLAGTYALRLKDVGQNVNSTEDDFQVETTCAISAPSPVQEGNVESITVSVTGASPGVSYFANVAVDLPSPLSTEYTQTVSLGTPNSRGTASQTVSFPGGSFQPNGSLIDYAGTYNVYFNKTQGLAQTQFTVGFLDSTSYHRGQTVTIRATGYSQNQAATLSISGNSANLDSESVTSSDTGVISKSWVVPSNAGVGTYTVTISGASKSIQDSEKFSINGYPVTLKTVNLAGEAVPYVQIQDTDAASNTVSNTTSDSNGLASINLESGPQVATTIWNGVTLGQTNFTVTGSDTYTVQCQLTDLRIKVQSESGVPIPFVTLDISFTYRQSNGNVQTAAGSAETDTTGTFVLNSTLPGVTYNINASLYSAVFNLANNTFNNISAKPISDILILCPTEGLTLSVVDSNYAAIPNARIELVELSNGLFYSATSDSSGAAASQVTFGVYRARVYKDNLLINETNIQAFSESQQQIRCTLYDIQVSISVVDFFGSPISNANVTLNGPATERFSAITKGDGTATFNNVIGGDMQIIAFAPGAQNDYQAITLTVNQPTSVQVKLDRYVALGSLLISVSSLIAIIVILVAIILLVIVEVYQTKKSQTYCVKLRICKFPFIRKKVYIASNNIRKYKDK